MQHLDLDVARLDLDCHNPRHGQVADQAAALAALMADQGRKLPNLALDIHSKGLNPAQRFIVIAETTGRYTVLDGNRRLAAVRLLADPLLVPLAVRPADFVTRVAAPGLRPNRVACCLLPDRESAAPWLERTHTGQRDGLGVMPWSPVAQHRFRPPSRRTQTSSAMAVLGWLGERTTDDTVHQQIGAVLEGASTNLGRLLTDQAVRALVGFDFKGHDVIAIAPEAALIHRFTVIVADLAGDTAVTALTLQKDREQHIRRLLGSDVQAEGDGEPTDASDPRTGHRNDADATSRTAGSTTASAARDNARQASSTTDQRQSTTRKGTRRQASRLFQDLEPVGLKTRTRSIFEELQQLDLGKFPNAAAVVLRSAIELSVVEYLESINVNLNTVKTLADRIEEAIDKLQVPKKSQRYHGITTELAKPYSLAGATNLNNYVHNPHHPPLHDELATISVRYTVLIQDISDVLRSNSRNQ